MNRFFRYALLILNQNFFMEEKVLFSRQKMSTFYKKAESFEIPISTNGNVYHERITVYLAIQRGLTLLSNISKKAIIFKTLQKLWLQPSLGIQLCRKIISRSSETFQLLISKAFQPLRGIRKSWNSFLSTIIPTLYHYFRIRKRQHGCKLNLTKLLFMVIRFCQQ